jgi:hypothetical protein
VLAHTDATNVDATHVVAVDADAVDVEDMVAMALMVVMVYQP